MKTNYKKAKSTKKISKSEHLKNIYKAEFSY